MNLIREWILESLAKLIFWIWLTEIRKIKGEGGIIKHSWMKHQLIAEEDHKFEPFGSNFCQSISATLSRNLCAHITFWESNHSFDCTWIRLLIDCWFNDRWWNRAIYKSSIKEILRQESLNGRNSMGNRKEISLSRILNKDWNTAVKVAVDMKNG